MAAVVQIVDGHAGSLVLELNDTLAGVGGLVKRGMNLTEGQLSGNGPEVGWSPLAGPSGLGRRRITLPFVLIGTSADNVGAKVAKLMLATQGPWWLRIRRHEASADSWLRCFGTVPFVESQITTSSTAHIVQGTISCETDPYALGARVDGSAAIGQDPANAAGWGININNVPGDSATPLLLRMNDPAAFALGGLGAFISVRRRQDPSALVGPALTHQIAPPATIGGTPGVSMTPISGDSAFSGGNGCRVSFSSPYVPLTKLALSFTGPSLSGPNAPGVYRVFVRIRRNTVALAEQLVLRPFVNRALITPEDITVPAGGAATRMVDLGLVQWPAAGPASIQAPVPNPSGATTTRIYLEFWRKITTTPTCIVDFDFMCWIPADEDSGFLTLDNNLVDPDTQYVVVDGYQQLAMITSGDPLAPHNILGQPYTSGGPTVDWTGRVPRVRPGTNRLFVVAGTGGLDTYPLALNLDVAYSYWPRFTWLR